MRGRSRRLKVYPMPNPTKALIRPVSNRWYQHVASHQLLRCALSEVHPTPPADHPPPSALRHPQSAQQAQRCPAVRAQHHQAPPPNQHPSLHHHHIKRSQHARASKSQPGERKGLQLHRELHRLARPVRQEKDKGTVEHTNLQQGGS